MNFTPISTVKDRFEELAKTRDEFEALELVARELGMAPEAVALAVWLPVVAV